MNIKELEEKSLIDLKAVVYDLLVKQQSITNELQVVNNLIAKKELEEKTESKK